MEPTTRYIERDGCTLAYQVFGTGPRDVVFMFEISGHLDLLWTDPDIHAVFDRVGSQCRCVVMQRRGFGLSDPVSYVPTVEQQAGDLLAVMDEVGLGKATLCGVFSTCAVVALVAASAPDRVRNLVLLHPFASGAKSEAVLDRGWPADVIPGLLAAWHSAFDAWGTGESLRNWDAGQVTGYNKRLAAMMERCSAPLAAATAYRDWIVELDFHDIFSSVSVPTRVLGIPLSLMPESVPRYVAEIIPGAEYVALPPTKLGMSMGEAWVSGFDHVIEFATGKAGGTRLNRFLGTVLFTDVVGSTEVLARVGDAGYREILAAHERQVRLLVDEAGGRVVNVVGDGTISLFDGPSGAVECARTICTQAHDLGLRVRSGVHTGELEHSGHDVTGMAVHLGARISAMAVADEVLVSRTVRDLSLGSDLTFHSRGEHELKGIPGLWEVYAVGRSDQQEALVPAESAAPNSFDRVALRMARRTPRLSRSMNAAGNALQRRRAGVPAPASR